jgi:hypothetical protein
MHLKFAKSASSTTKISKNAEFYADFKVVGGLKKCSWYKPKTTKRAYKLLITF